METHLCKLSKCRVRVLTDGVEVDVAADRPLRTFTATFRNMNRPGWEGTPVTQREKFKFKDDDERRGEGYARLPSNFKVGAVIPELLVEVLSDGERPALKTGHDVRVGAWVDLLLGSRAG